MCICQVQDGKEQSSQTIKTDFFVSIIDQLPGLVDVKLQGIGEPFANPD